MHHHSPLLITNCSWIMTKGFTSTTIREVWVAFWSTLVILGQLWLKFIYSEKATKFCEIFILLLSYVVPVKSKVKISQNFVAFSEYMNCNTKFHGQPIQSISASLWMVVQQFKMTLTKWVSSAKIDSAVSLPSIDPYWQSTNERPHNFYSKVIQIVSR